LAIGVPYADPSNITRWKHTGGKNLRCRGNNWYVPDELPDQDARWLALLVDTEGSISVSVPNPKSHSAVVAIANCDRPLLEIAQRLIGGGSIYETQPKQNKFVTSRRKQFRLTVSSKSAYDLLIRIYPWMIVKERQARAAIYLESLKKPPGLLPPLTDEEIILRERIRDAIKALNQDKEVDDSWIPDLRSLPPTLNTQFIPYSTIQSRDKNRPHPATFPKELPAMCFKLHGLREGLIGMDPFLGIGNAALAAQELDFKKFIGFDIDPFYVHIAKEKIQTNNL
jgi:hypothetical protein